MTGADSSDSRIWKAIIIRSLYGLRASGNSYRHHLATCLQHLGYESCKADPDIWYKAESKPNGETYYAYLLVYVDDIMAIGTRPRDTLMKLNKYYKIKNDSIGPPDLYLGAKLKRITLEDGTTAWGQSSSKYVRSAIANVKDWISKRGYRLPSKCSTPMSTSYRPELDISRELASDEASFYQSMIGVLRWAVELGRIDIATETSMLAAHLALPREGHMFAAFRVFAYLDKHHNSRLVFDPRIPSDDPRPTISDWTQFYGNVEEAIPSNAPAPRGKAVTLRCFVDSDHAGDHITRRSRTGYIICVNSAPIQWYTKKQSTVESSTFGAEFIAMKTAVEALRGLRYKLRMMGVEIDGPTNIFGDNMSVLHNTTAPESTLKKKANAIAYHVVREAVAMGECLTSYIRSEENVAARLI